MSRAGRTHALVLIFITALIDMIGFGIIIPVLPYFAEHFGANGFMVGLLTAVYLVMQFLFAPWWGSVSDRIGRRPVILICILATSLTYILFGLATSLWMIFAARVAGGIFAGKFSTIQAYIADVTTKENRSKGMGLFGAAFGLGFILGPVIGGILGHYGYQWPLFFAAAISLLNGAVAYFLIPESLTPEMRARADESRRRSRLTVARYLAILRFPVVGPSLVLSTVFNFAFSMLYSTFALFVEREFNYHSRETGYLFAFLGIISAILQGGMIGKLTKWIGERKMITWGLFMTAAGMFCLSISDIVWLLITALLLIALGSGLLTPALSGLISQKTADQHQGQVLGFMQSLATLARIGGMIFGGFVFEHVTIWSPFWSSGLCLVLGTGYAVLFLKQPAGSPQLEFAGEGAE